MIERENREWGVRLIAQPFHGPGMNTNMKIYAEISNPRPKRNPEITIVFNGVPIQNPLRAVDAQTWGEALSAVIAEARNVFDELKAKKVKSSKSASARTRRRNKRAK